MPDGAGLTEKSTPELDDALTRDKREKTGVNPKDLMGLKKPPINLVPASAIIEMAQAMGDGAKKYGPYNWREKDVIASIYVGAAMRHLLAWGDGEQNARDSGRSHLGHALACLAILVDAQRGGNLIDDRPSEGPAADMIEEYTEK